MIRTIFGSLLLLIYADLVDLVAQELTELDLQSESSHHEQGRAIYNYRCYFCHGYSGNARTLTATYVQPPPRDFTQTGSDTLSRAQMIDTVTHGKPNTAMTGFSRLLSSSEIAAVVDFVRKEFMQNRLENSRYHTLENGWPNHLRYQIAFPFARGDIPLDRPDEQLNVEQLKGRQLFLTSCITCHDRSVVKSEGDIWQKQSISYPRNNYSHTEIDALSSASIYALHDLSPATAELSSNAKAGKLLWLDNCAFCHGADGSGQNWIGSFLEPNPRDLRDPAFMSLMNRKILALRIEQGLANSSMPAWRDVLTPLQIEQIIDYISEAFYPITD